MLAKDIRKVSLTALQLHHYLFMHYGILFFNCKKNMNYIYKDDSDAAESSFTPD